MLIILLWLSVGLWSLFLINTLITWAFVPRLDCLSCDWPDHWPSLSIVVPARNEERGIERAVRSFCEQDYPGIEVIVVNDRSTDKTPEILDMLLQQFQNLTVIQATDPRKGWLGKPNALEIGRKAAKGDWLLFVDADVEYSSDLTRRAMAFALQQKTAMLVLWPRFVTGEALEAVAMSTSHLMAGAVVPLFLANWTQSKWFPCGNGVFNMVRRDALEDCGAFESLKDVVLDDVGLGFRVKEASHRLTVALGGSLARIRMYFGTRELIQGFAKNAYPMSGGRWWLLGVPFVFGAIVSLAPYGGLALGLFRPELLVASLVSLGLMHLTMVLLVVRFHQRWYVTFTTPLREIIWWIILLNSFFAYRRKGLVWRDRKYGKFLDSNR